MTDRIFLVDKPFRWTSFDVVKKVKNLLSENYKGKQPGFKSSAFKVGHAGTLDPLATGLLILCTGKLTKKISEIQDAEKEYIASFTIGSVTSSFDLETELDQITDYSFVTEDLIRKTARSFTGTISQTPPAHSAIKISGVRAYEKARKGEIVDMKTREVHIKEFEIVAIDLPKIDVRVVCTKGTYVRSLANDFGKELGCGAHLSYLCRTRIGEYLLKNAISMDDFKNHIVAESAIPAEMQSS
jgi:tRNA pseudouridine55 synthase